jgi:hypothetical protein
MIKTILGLSLGDKIAIFIPFVVMALVAFGLTFPPGIIQSVSYKSFVAVIACINLWAVLRIMDLQAGINFRIWWTDEKNTNRGAYLCFRIIAFAIIVSFVFAFA